MKKIIGIAALTAAAIVAQPAQIIEDKQVRVINRTGGPGPGMDSLKFIAEANFEASVVKGVPFSGDFVTENAQTLADGNKIKNSNTTIYARDSEGRTRREITINAIGPFPATEASKHIFIHDPVAKVDYVLDPQERTARKVMIGAMFTQAMPAAPGKEGPEVGFTQRIEGPVDHVVGGSVTAIRGPVIMERMPLPPGIVTGGPGGAVFSQRITIADGANAPTTNFKNESLGKQVIEGVEAEGTRTTLTIPAGQIGNDRALETVSERWYSNELKTVVLTTRKDPRSGESTYKLTNLRRGEPARQLFEVPLDYKLITEDNYGPNVLRMKIEKERKQEVEAAGTSR
jgi:hypothetical protein